MRNVTGVLQGCKAPVSLCILYAAYVPGKKAVQMTRRHGHRWHHLMLIVLLLALVIFGPLLEAQSGPASDGVVTFREGVVGQVQRINPVFADLNPIDRDITSLIFEGLTQINQFGEVVPDLAESWVVSSDGLEYVFTLRDDVLWQDGIPFTADDVVYTMSVLVDPSYPGDPAIGQFWQTVETQKINDHLVRFRLTQPLASFPEALRIGMLPYHALRGTNAEQLASHPINFHPIGTGPYQLERLVGNDSIERVDLRVAPTYRQRSDGQEGYAIDRFSFVMFDNFDAVREALLAGSIDAYASQDRYMIPLLMPMGTQYAVYTTYEPSVGFVVFNWVSESLPVFREEPVRQALMTGANISDIVTRNLSSVAVPASSPLPLLTWAHEGSVDLPPYDPQAAQTLLSRSIIDVDSGDPNILFRFSILAPEDPMMPTLARELAAQWSQLALEVNGSTRRIEATAEVVDAEVYRERLENGEFDVAIVEYSTAPSADPDVYAFWHQGQYPDGLNYGGANDRRISEALERARRDPNGTNRAIHYDNFQRLFIERAVAIPLYYPLMVYLVNPAVEGVQVGYLGARSDRFNTIQDWRFTG
jgi:peptide/nickel transport system substrate-binding protein